MSEFLSFYWPMLLLWALAAVGGYMVGSGLIAIGVPAWAVAMFGIWWMLR